MSRQNCGRWCILAFTPDILFRTVYEYLLLHGHLRGGILPARNDLVLTKKEINRFKGFVITRNVVPFFIKAFWVVPVSFPKEFYVRTNSWSFFTITWFECD
jgi:hypothetical protein